jgi:hypothetical protein
MVTDRGELPRDPRSEFAAGDTNTADATVAGVAGIARHYKSIILCLPS